MKVGCHVPGQGQPSEHVQKQFCWDPWEAEPWVWQLQAWHQGTGEECPLARLFQVADVCV